MLGDIGAIMVWVTALVVGFFGAKHSDIRTRSASCFFLALFVGGCFIWPAYAETGYNRGAILIGVAVVAFLVGIGIHQAMKGKMKGK